MLPALMAIEADHPTGVASPEAQGAVLVAALVQRAALPGVSVAQRKRLMTDAARMARQKMGRAAIAAGGQRERGPARSNVDLLRLMAERVEQGGYLALGESLLDALYSLDLAPRDRARVLSDRARNSRKRNYSDLSLAQYEEVRRIGRQLKSPELQARAWMGLATLAQVRGNFPEMERCARQGVRLAERAGYSKLAAMGQTGLGVRAATAGQYSVAVQWLALAYGNANGDRRLTTEILTNVAQILYESGWLKESRDAAVAVIRITTTVRVAASSLGAYVLASGGLGDRKAVDWAAKQAVKWGRLSGHAREVAGVFYECALAYARIGAVQQSDVLLRRAASLAEKHGFHDLVFQIAELPTAPRQVPLAPKAAAFTLDLAQLAGEGVPSELEVADV